MQDMSSSLPNILFLDIDGVLCTHRACVATSNTGLSSYLDPIACLLVKNLCLDNNARIVISSSWRSTYDQLAMRAILNSACPALGDFTLDDIVWWCTRSWVYSDDNDNTSDRGREISHWIYNNYYKFNNLVIIDDMADMRPLQESLVRCDVYDGLGYRQYQDAYRMLKFN